MHYCTCGDIHTSFRNISRLTAPSPSPRATRRRTKAWRCCSGRALMSPAPHPPSGEGEGGEEEFLLPGESARVTCRRSSSESGRWEPERPEFIRSNSPLKRLARSLNKYLVLPHQGGTNSRYPVFPQQGPTNSRVFPQQADIQYWYYPQ